MLEAPLLSFVTWLLDCISRRDHEVPAFLCLTFITQMTPSASIHVVTNGGLSFLFMAEYYSIVCVCVHYIFFIRSSICG